MAEPSTDEQPTEEEPTFEGFGTGSAEDYRQAQWLAIKLNREWRYDHGAGRWHHWNKVRWAPDERHEIEHKVATLAAEHLKPGKTDSEAGRKALIRLLNMASINRALEALSTFPDYSTDGADWDQVPYLLGCRNGIVDLRYNTIDTHPDPTCLVTMTTSRHFTPCEPSQFAERAPEFLKFLSEITSNDPEMVNFLLMWYGASLFGFSPEQRFLLMTGIGRNGKGTLRNAIMKATGEYSRQPDANVYMRSKFGAARSNEARADLIDLKGKRIGFFSEPAGGKFNEEMLKAHTGGDIITARQMYSHVMVSWEPTHSITILVNDAPEVDDIGPSMGNRVMVADFRERYEGAKEDKQLYATLAGEADGILSILCWVAKQWYELWSTGQGGLFIPPRVLEQSKAFMERNDQVASFLDEACQLGNGYKVQSKLLYDAYLQWHAREDRQEVELSQVKFPQMLERKGFKKVKGEMGQFWLGIKPKGAMQLADEEDDDGE